MSKKDVDLQKQGYMNWAKEKLGKETGFWYAPYLEQLGALLRDFEIFNIDVDNFFEFQSYDEFKQVYKNIIGQSDDDIVQIINGKQKRYPSSYAGIKQKWNENYARYRVDKGLSNNEHNYGGIADIGPILRAYLKYLYYDENPNLVYKGENNPNIQYWNLSPGEDAKYWDSFIKEGIIGIGWDDLGDLRKYNSQNEIFEELKKGIESEAKPSQGANMVWSFGYIMKPGDIVFIKWGKTDLIGRGVITSDYYYDDGVPFMKHRHKIEWTNIGHWKLSCTFARKTLTLYDTDIDTPKYLESVINGDNVNEPQYYINEFIKYLSTQVDQNGQKISFRTGNLIVNLLKDLKIFGITEIALLKLLKQENHNAKNIYAIDYYIDYIISKPNNKENEPYYINNFLEEVFVYEKEVEGLLSLIKNKKNLILKGAPGVGKTFIARRLAHLMMEEKDDDRVQMVQFHQSYSYEDFIEGYRPKVDGEGFELKQGPFITFANKAARDQKRDYFFIIDEINRGNISKILGELMMLIETDKRGESINLLYSNEKFYVPNNLYIIGMMNTADRSLALIDYALRRRFAFYEIAPALDNQTFVNKINNLENNTIMLKVIDVIKELNIVIEEELGSGFKIGHSYFVVDDACENVITRTKEIVRYEIIPQLEEYWFDDVNKANEWAQRLMGACSVE